MDEKKREPAALVPKESGALVPTASDKPGYWGRNARRLRACSRVLLLLLLTFIIVFTALNYHAFSPLNLYYFGQDLKGLPAQVGGEARTLYYDYGGENDAVAVYRGGVAVASRQNVKIYASDGALLLSLALDKPMSAPRAVASRDYLIVFDFGSTTFLVFNAHDLLYEGESGAAILGVGLSDAGCFSLIVASDTSLSAVELFDAGFRHTHRFGRASATVAAPLSNDGRTLALVGATAAGAQVDFVTFGEGEARASVLFEGFPLAAEFTGNGVLTVLTTKGLYTVTAMGKSLGVIDFDGAAPIAYDIGSEGSAVALLTDKLTGASRVLAVSRRGYLRASADFTAEVTAVAIGDSYFYALSGETATVLRAKNGEVLQTAQIPTGYLAVTSMDSKTARILYSAMALPLLAE